MAYKHFIAKTREGIEYLHSKEHAYFVSEASANAITEALNRARWGLKEGEKWHLYETEYTTDMYVYRAIKRYKNKIYIAYV